MSTALTTAPNNLWALQGQLFEMLEAREEALARVREMKIPDGSEYAPSEVLELRAIESGISRFVEEKVSEVTEIRACYMALTDAAAIAKAEAARATNRAMILENRAARVKELIKTCMETLGVKRFESAMGYFLLRGNGGAQPVVVTDETLVPDEYCQVTVTMCFQMWKEICAQCGDALVATTKTGPRTPRLSTIAEALNAPCPRCDGNGVVEAWGNLYDDAEYRPAENPCKECQGTGKQSVAGCHLGPRGESVVVK